MDFPYWTSSEVQSATFDEATNRWTVQVLRGDGSVRTMHPVHVIMAVGGVGGKPNVPHIDGIENFKGNVIHSTQFKTGNGYHGKRVLVVGTATSAHDIALDLHRHEAAYVALAQRSPTSVVDIETANMVYGLNFDPDMPQEEADQRFSASYIWPLMAEGLKGYVQYVVEPTHGELFAQLEAAGLRLDQGDDGLGWMGKYLKHAGGYYLNVGASDVIIEGGIKVLQFDDFDDFVPEGVRLTDGTVVELDEIILATGFQNLSSEVEGLFGPEVARKVGQIGGIGEDGEPRNMVQPTGQQHLWFIFGGIADARKATPWLALQIKANLAGIAPSFVRNPDGSLTAIERD
jgi:putative flavoprotein involved in K+ transport